MQEVLAKITELTGKKHVQLADRGNSAIKIALDLASRMGKTTVLIPDQGGWLTFKKFPKKYGLELKEIKTNDGLIDLDELEKTANNECVLLTCSMPGYFAIEDIEEVYKICSKKGCMLINDVSGSIGTDAAKIGDVLVCSFGKWKPLNLEYGGFIATDDDAYYTEFDASYFDEYKYEDILKKFEELPSRLKMFEEKRAPILEELQSFNIVHRDKKGINVVIKFEDDEIKERIIDYCKENKFEYTTCPRYIRVESPAISIEIKRL